MLSSNGVGTAYCCCNNYGAKKIFCKKFKTECNIALRPYNKVVEAVFKNTLASNIYINSCMLSTKNYLPHVFDFLTVTCTSCQIRQNNLTRTAFEVWRDKTYRPASKIFFKAQQNFMDQLI